MLVLGLNLNNEHAGLTMLKSMRKTKSGITVQTNQCSFGAPSVGNRKLVIVYFQNHSKAKRVICYRLDKNIFETFSGEVKGKNPNFGKNVKLINIKCN